MEPFSVNKALASIETLADADILVFGALAFEFENVGLYHIPKRERNTDDYKSSLWLSIDMDYLGVDREVCKRWHGKTVIVEGQFIKPDPLFGGCGHLSLWLGEILVRTIERFKYRNDK